MNLQLNFIQPSEVRSASVVSLKSLIQIGAVMIPLVLGLTIVMAYVGYAEQRSSLALLEGTWGATEARQQRAQALSQQLKERESARDELQGWSQSRQVWHDLMDHVRQEVPATVQLKVLQARQTLEIGADGHAQRALRIIMNGRCEGPDAEGKVEALRRAIASAPPLGERVQEARVAGFREDTEADATPDDRAFQIEVDFMPRSLHATAPK